MAHHRVVLPDLTSRFFAKVTDAIEYAAFQRGYQVPLCNSIETVPLTTVDQPKHEMARWAAELLLGRLEARPSSPVRRQCYLRIW